ncbi:hybrid sensor histidine kinase/response regulator [Parahaliea sp. F7430]|uniref:histidine kinase n=1 Tax=Sediminihaliea albiluteola TaxID=2758564 RepID=A0A7W2TV73_9GAMM|nr:7TM-DISM domain-containing protein [Sediminihaliea albiluteola]MBA6412483.1 hybrid sensor histidine kinase/response regulator [Sediminihaliea albiluteola]
MLKTFFIFIYQENSRSLVLSQLRVLYLLTLTALIFLGPSNAAAAVKVLDCAKGSAALSPWLLLYEDRSAGLGVSAVSALPQEEWHRASATLLAPGPSSSALWLRLQLTNSSSQSCQRHLFLGSAKTRDLQLYQQRDGNWHRSVGGSHYPFDEWAVAARPFAFPLTVAAGESSSLLLRLSSPITVAVDPMLLTDLDMLQVRMAEGLADGLVVGFVLLLVMFSISLGLIYRSKLLLLYAGSVLAYVSHVLLVNAYGLEYLWPQLPELDLRLALAASLMTRLLVLEFVVVLLQVRQQALFSRILCYLCRGGFWCLVLCSLFFPQINSLSYGGALHGLLGLLVPVIYFFWLLQGYRQGLAYNWLCYLVPSLIFLQSSLHYAFLFGYSQQSPFEYSWLSLSTLPGALLLAATLINQVALSRRAERQAKQDVELLRRTARSRLESTVKLRTSQLKASLHSQRMLLARISHDLRAPLQQVMADLVNLRGRTLAEGRIDAIEQNMRYQLALIDDLLEYSTEELKQLELRLAPGYLMGFLELSAEQGKFLAKRYGNQFYFDCAKQLPAQVEADFKRLRQVLVNLLANAAKYTQKGKISFRVEALLQRGEMHTLRFIVEDNGIGLAKGQQLPLQKPFQRDLKALAKEGKGLGLYIVRELLQLMGSELQLKPGAEGGSCYFFDLSLKSVSEDSLEQVYIESYVDDWDGEGLNILIAETSATSQNQLMELLSGYGCQVEVSSELEQALSLMRSQEFHLVITEHSFSSLSGEHLVSLANQEGIQVPFLFYDSKDANPVEQYALRTTVRVAQLRRPATSAALLAQISQIHSPGTGADNLAEIDHSSKQAACSTAVLQAL